MARWETSVGLRTAPAGYREDAVESVGVALAAARPDGWTSSAGLEIGKDGPLALTADAVLDAASPGEAVDLLVEALTGACRAAGVAVLGVRGARVAEAGRDPRG